MSDYLGVLGGTGLTAYIGLTEIAPVAKGDVVFISGAAGAVGLAAGSMARSVPAPRARSAVRGDLPVQLDNVSVAIVKRLSLKGFIVFDHLDRQTVWEKRW
ncbi:hypothetical protein [Amycolatopsis pithecellobii]|uniref:hypothetical protein n=1 Tax=Amycolatopsis pithecellobii TaxID=664692 RepID=UPI001AA0795B|nr:hypothetical protein [Amycolatopsis pithecellobii]